MPTATLTQRKAILDLARSQLGVHEIPSNSNRTPYTSWYGMVGPWCAMFVSWVFWHAGFPLHITTEKGFAYCPYGVSWFKSQGKWASKNVRPQPGWIIFFDFIGRPSHVGIVEGIAPDGRIITLEGNTNGAGSRTGGNVMRHYRSLSSGVIGYGIIDYEGDAPVVVPPASSGDNGMLRIGSRGQAVADWQKILVGAQLLPANGVDGDFGPRTEAATKQFQAKLGLEADGIVGPATRQKTAELLAYLAALQAAPAPVTRPTIQQGSRGDHVRYLQAKLGLAQDGIFGPRTRSAVIAFQRRRGLIVDGIVGPRTWTAVG